MPLRKKILFVIIFSLLLFSAMRAMLLLVYLDFFHDLTRSEIFFSFLHGLKFDVSVSLTFLALPVLMLVLPHKVFERRSWQRWWWWVVFTVIAIMAFVLIGDLIYFEQVKRHVFDELLFIGEDISLLLKLTLTTYFWILLLFILGAALLGIIWARFIVKIPSTNNYRILTFFLVILFFTAGIRGSFSLKPISIVDAYISNNSKQGLLILNGVFSIWQASINTKRVSYSFFGQDRLHEIMAQLNIDSNVKYPFLRKITGKPPFVAAVKKPNIVIFLLESWGNFYVDSFGKQNFRATPNFDLMAKGGVKFTNFYACGSRSIEGIQAILTSLPPLKGSPTLSLGLEALAITKLGEMFDRLGYRTMFFQSGKRRSFRLDVVANSLGFKEYFGSEDYPRLLDYKDSDTPEFGWDYEAFMHMLTKISSGSAPFFSFIYTGTTHTPFQLGPVVLKKEGHGTDNETGFLNTLYYSDWSLGRFFQEARKTSWFKDTIFVFTADHAYPAYREFTFLDQYKIPLLIYAPDILAPREINKIGSHFDIMPTLMNLLDFTQPLVSFGTSLFDEHYQGLGLIAGRFGDPAIITKQGYLKHTLKKRLEANSMEGAGCDEGCFARMENWLLGINQLTYQLIKENRWTPAKE